MVYRASWLTCVCVSLLLGCGHPIRDLANAAKDLLPDDAPPSAQSCPGAATSRIELIANLDATDDVPPRWDATRPERSSNFSVDRSAYAGDGQAVEIQIFFARSGERSWDWHVLAGAPALERGNGQLTFDAEGALLAAETTTQLRLPRADGSLSAPVALWLGTPQSTDADGFDGVTSTSEPSRLYAYEQDGRAQVDGSDCPGT